MPHPANAKLQRIPVVRMTTVDDALAYVYVNDIDANVAAFYADRIDYDTFGRNQVAIWDDIEAAGSDVRDAVLAILRGRM